MSDTRAETLDHTDVLDAFDHAAFDGPRRGNAPSLIVAMAPVRIVWANAAATAFLAASELELLAERLGDLTRRSDDFLRRPAAGAPRLERLRVLHHRSARLVTVLCRRIELAGNRPALALAVMGFDAGSAAAPWDQDQGQPWDITGREPASSTRQAATLPEPASDRLRFVWRTDALGRVVQVDPAAFAAIEAPVVPVCGTSLVETVREIDPAGAMRLAASLAASPRPLDVEVIWSASGGTATVPVLLKASPWFGADRAFAGFRGFGLVDVARRRASKDTPAPLERQAPPAEVLLPVTLTSFPDGSDGSSGPEPSGPPEPRPDRTDQAPVPPANVVQLRPLALIRAPIEDEQIASHAEPLEPSAPSDVDPAVGRSVDTEPTWDVRASEKPLATDASGLSSSEHEAFQEIGRTLGRPVAVNPFQDSAGASKPDRDAGPPQVDALADLDRNAGTLVDAMAAGLLVLRGPKLVFANQAVLDLLHYATQADAELGIGAALAQAAPRTLAAAAVSVGLPAHDGASVRFDVQITPIVWSGVAARLWTLRLAEAAGGEPGRDQPCLERDTSVPGNPPSSDNDLLDLAGEAIAVLDRSGRILSLNRAGERLFGRKRRETKGEDFASLMAPESRATATAMLEETRGLAGEPTDLSRAVTAQATNGGWLELELRLVRIGDDLHGAVWRERPAVRSTEPSAPDRREAVNRQPELLAKLSHQVRTPLNAIIGFAEVMMDERFGPLGNTRYKEYLKDVHASGTQVMSLVNDLLDLSRIESGRHDLDLGAVDINRVIAEGVTQVQADAHRARVIVRTSFSPRQPMVTADDGAARQIVANLLSNAIKFNEPGGQVIVSTTTGDAGMVLVRIRDTGIGMSDKEIETALEPFRQLAPSRQAEGAGLGLPLTKALVGANGASLAIRSRPGEGTMVEVTFQAAAAPARVPA